MGRGYASFTKYLYLFVMSFSDLETWGLFYPLHNAYITETKIAVLIQRINILNPLNFAEGEILNLILAVSS